jgi:hypothetical protein
VPEAIALWSKIAPHISVGATLTDEHVKEINELAPIALSLTQRSRDAVAALVDTHAPAVKE